MKNKLRWVKIAVIGIGLTVLVICYSVSGTGKIRLMLPEEEVWEKAADGAGDRDGFYGNESSGMASAEPAGDKDTGVEEPSDGGDDYDRMEAETAGSRKGEAGSFIFVHVCGEVLQPGVYELESGSRVYQAVESAGGLTDRAAADFINMALVLQDGQQLRIPDREEADAWDGRNGSTEYWYITPAAGAASQGMGGLINLNTATREELMTLSGIGEAKADAILAYRDENGGFQKIEDVMKVPGIKEAAFQKIKDSITV